jgi:ribonucleoside-diphosphate reductase alpha chain
VIDPVAKRLISEGVEPGLIEDAYKLAEDVERRVRFQEWIQQVVDHGISSTINLPSWGSEFNNSNRVRSFGNMLIKHLPGMRGITTYPDGSRGGQPLNPVPYAEAVGQEGVELVEEQQNVCSLTGGSCGD